MARKGLRLIDGVPMVLAKLRTLSETDGIDRVILSTDDPEAAGIARLHGFDVIDRPAELASDTATVAEVAKHAVEALEWSGDVLLAQPTSPLVTAATIERAIKEWDARERRVRSIVSVTTAQHITWGELHDGIQPLMPRVNRQQQEPRVWTENGALFLATNELVRSGKLVADLLPFENELFVLDGPEAIDIDTHADLAAARLATGRKRIQFRVAVGREVGSGHLYRCLRLAEELAHHDIQFSFDAGAPGWARNMVADRGFYGFSTIEAMDAWTPDLVVFDCLDTHDRIVLHAKQRGQRVVTFEDDGPGATYADLVVNELGVPDGSNVLAGPRYSILRAEFAALPPYVVKDRVERVAIVLGGTDAANLSGRLAFVIRALLPQATEVRVILGPGVPVDHEPDIKGVTVLRDVRSMAEELHAADLVVTSHGRTTFECAAVGVPLVSVAANERESRHHKLPGGIYLGPWVTVSDRDITETVIRMESSPQFRRECSDTLRRHGPDGHGLARVLHHVSAVLDDLR